MSLEILDQLEEKIKQAVETIQTTYNDYKGLENLSLFSY